MKGCDLERTVAGLVFSSRRTTRGSLELRVPGCLGPQSGSSCRGGGQQVETIKRQIGA